MKLALIGGGNMAEAILRGVLGRQLFAPQDLIVADISAERLAYIQAKYQAPTTISNIQALRGAENVLLAVKPQAIDSVLAELNTLNNRRQFVISIAAGVPLAKIAGQKKFRAARAMPNTPALIGQAASAFCCNELATPADREFVLRLLQSIGTAVEVDEKDLNAVTGLSGSGPAFVFRLMDYFIQAGAGLGLPENKARTLVYQTFLGSAALAAQSGRPLAELIAQVTSPQGTTQAGREILEKSAVARIINDTIIRAKERADELAQGKYNI
ncbi:MAG: pyrroline-5-carboxylate reductase [Candidatus Margulisbacteria bacterium]|jgi:pyrroline-5-carboxylate reductase|nr:pyrroline-5-carboxylate reductase [Candidatus Margulisiibacteriota bacterium]